ncbi:hypothetical protein NCCP2140_37980 [Pseudoalteromonas sp. NCCP-2140]|uniref:helix-turn-helix transcriptional regulator n=1 Tax=Pseudoalteromonas TaxID=53246 RepID=UPI001582326A|nr:MULTISPECIES: WYL domain-containing protein [Pseudoalteromonas]MDI4651140.1 WYL domain-containing protein [Pseudoalteromonas shioyasakiensis]NUJ37647.1 WYL domain-containing protein [Pseudoalteromonas sp. 0303]GKW54745.1 hypothetical protein NCCP2140_37980 [Pseudoalteromonas sp. NCCP-2140]
MADTKLAQRLAELLSMLNAGELLSPSHLSVYFNVSARTLRRDIYERLSFLDIQCTPTGEWFLERSSPSKLNHKAIALFAEKSGVRELFPFFTNELLDSLIGNSKDEVYLIKTNDYEYHDTSAISTKFQQLESAIRNNRRISFSYKGKNYSDIEPYNLVHFDGFWYLAGTDSGTLKSFHISLMKTIWPNNTGHFIKAPNIQTKIKTSKTIWFGGEQVKVLLSASAEVAHYLLRKKSFPNQHLESTSSNGSIFFSVIVANQKQLFPLIMKWLPHVQIIEPIDLRHKLNNQLLNYLNNQKDIYGH